MLNCILYIISDSYFLFHLQRLKNIFLLYFHCFIVFCCLWDLTRLPTLHTWFQTHIAINNVIFSYDLYCEVVVVIVVVGGVYVSNIQPFSTD